MTTRRQLLQHRYSILRIIGRRFAFFTWFFLAIVPVTGTAHETDGSRIAGLLSNGSWCVQQDAKIVGSRPDEPMIPASTVKILTALLALEQLGPDYRFKTALYYDDQQNLYIRGSGDPFLTSEILASIALQLKELGIHRVENIYLDDSRFAVAGPSPGSEHTANPYDTSNGGLVVNFNAVAIRKDARNIIHSGEPQTPFLPLMRELGKSEPPGLQRINIDVLKTDGMPPSLRYTGELIIAQLQRVGIRCNGTWHRQPVAPTLPPILVHQSTQDLLGIVQACLKFSNNFIANQLFLSCGANSFGYPATWEKARRNMAQFIANNLQLNTSQLYIDDGSGLSRQNRLTSRELVHILDHFRPYSRLLPEKSGILVKSGTMKGVFCYAGYLPGTAGLLPFAIMLNQDENNRDRVLAILAERFAIKSPIYTTHQKDARKHKS